LTTLNTITTKNNTKPKQTQCKKTTNTCTDAVTKANKTSRV